jgi:hypothetical protein
MCGDTVVNRALAETVVGCLRFSGDQSNQFAQLGRFGCRDWKRTLGWLDASGMALYFLQAINDKNARSVLPTEVLVCLDQQLSSNRNRVLRLAEEIAAINHRFDRAHVRYAVIKGFSLVPLFCKDISLRAQADVDYLVDGDSRDKAKHALVEAGYVLEEEGSFESKFGKPPMRIATRFDNSYGVHAEVGIELHTAIWNGELLYIPFSEPTFSLDRTRTMHWRDLTFPVLSDLDIFALQIVHAFHHVLNCWVRMSWLFEIGFFLTQQESNESFWIALEQYAAEMPQLREFAAIVIQLVSNIFGAPVPAVVERWIEEIRPAAKLWIGHFGREWAFENHPYQEFSFRAASKLVLFLHELYAPDAETRKRIRNHRLFPWKQPARVAVAIPGKPTTTIRARWLQLEHLVRRTIFHVTTGSRYFWEYPSWRDTSDRRG